MKTYSYILILILGLSMLSCEKYLSVDSANIRSVETVEDIRGMLGGYLLTVKSPSYHMNSTGNPYSNSWYDMTFFPNGDVIRMFYYYENSIVTREYLAQYAGDIQKEAFLEGMIWSMKDVHKYIWENAYLSIGFMNHIVTETVHVTGDEQIRQQVLGEAKIIRCWHAFKLLQYFAPYDNNELGIPLNFDSETEHTTSGSRLKQTEVYQIIIKELQEVLTYTAATSNEYNIFYRKPIIHALLAQIYQYKADGPAKETKDWENARTHATEALSHMSLATAPEELNTLFKSPEVTYSYTNPHALAVFFWDGKGAKKDLIMQWGYPQYWEAWEDPDSRGLQMDAQLLSMYSDTDIRMQDNIYVYNRKNMEIGKYVQAPDVYGVRDILSMFRAADMHLTIAESYAKEGDNGNAKKWLDDFKTARKAGTWSSSDVLQEILNERRKEFVFEFDYRWLDMKRYRLSASHEYIHPQIGLQTATLDKDDYRYSFYIPEDIELSTNKNLKQNPGW